MQVAKPPIAPTSSLHHQTSGPATTSAVGLANGAAIRTTKTGRTPMAYGGQRSATTSIMTQMSAMTTPPPQSAAASSQQAAAATGQSRMTTLQKQYAKNQQQVTAQLPNGYGNFKLNTRRLNT